MSTAFLTLTPRDPLVARDGRPFGRGQGNRMRGLSWPLPSVVAGSLRTALVKATDRLDFSGGLPRRLMQVAVAGVFPVHRGQLYVPCPLDAVGAPGRDGGLRALHRAQPQEVAGGCDFPNALPLRPVLWSAPPGDEDFKPAPLPAWWPLAKAVAWLTDSRTTWGPDWVDDGFLGHPLHTLRDHVSLDPGRGAADEGQIFATSNLHLTHLPRFVATPQRSAPPWAGRYAEVTLAARMTVDDAELEQAPLELWHPLGGERRLVHWSRRGDAALWQCPEPVRAALRGAKRIRLVLATPAVFAKGWRPAWLSDGSLQGAPPGNAHVQLRLVGAASGRWRAVSGWSLQPLEETGRPGPKPIRRMVPAGSVYFFEVASGDPASLADQWLAPVSDDPQEQRDGFGLALWGTW
jgi:CRISPR-associated protein Cmr3